MKFQRFGCNPFAVFIITSVLGNFADIDLRIEVCSKCLMMVSCITVDDIQILDFIEVMFGSISRIDTTYSRVESASQDCGQASFLKAFLVCPLPTVFEVSFVFRLIVCRIQVVYAGFQTSFHDGQVLIRKSYVNNDFGFKTIE